MNISKDKKIYQDITPETKLMESLALYYAARELKRAALKSFYPKLTENEVEKKVREVFNSARY